MPSWKKVVVSGSDASLNSLLVTTSVTASIFSGSFTGSLFGTASRASTASLSELSVFLPAALDNDYPVAIGGITPAQPAALQSYVGFTMNPFKHQLKVSSSVSASSFTGSLSGTASWAKNSHTSSYVDNLNQNLVITGSVIMSGSSETELTVLGDQQITGSLRVTNGVVAQSFTGSLFGTASWALNASILVSASTVSNNLSQIVFSNSNNVSFGLNGSTITATVAAGGAVESHYEPYPLYNDTQTTTFNSSQILLGGLVNIPTDVSISWMRIPASVAFGSTTLASSTGATSAFFTNGHTFGMHVYSLANSTQLTHVYSNSATMTMGVSFTRNSNSATFNQNIAYPIYSGGGGSATVAISQTNSGLSYSLLTTATAASQLAGVRYIDMPFNTSLPGGAYVFGFWGSSSTNTGLSAILTNNTFNVSTMLLTNAIFPRGMGVNSTAATAAAKFGLGYYANANTANYTSAIAFSLISSTVSAPVIPFALFRF